MSDFKDAQVGDKVYALDEGPGEIIEIGGSADKFPIRVAHKRGGIGSYTLNGNEFLDHTHSDLYWAEPMITETAGPPARPKTITRYLNLNSTGIGGDYDSQEEADKWAQPTRIECREIAWTVPAAS